MRCGQRKLRKDGEAGTDGVRVGSLETRILKNAERDCVSL